MSAHECTAECWALMLRYGLDSSSRCDPFAARAAADREAEAAGAFAFPHEH